MISFANLICILLAHLIESWISPGCSYEFNSLYGTTEITVFAMLQQQMKYTLSRTRIKENH